MSVIYVVLPLALLIAVAALVAFIWAVRAGQLDDLDTPSVRMLLDDADQARASTRTGRNSRVERPTHGQ